MKLLTIFLTINALFWGLMPHSTHCNVALKMGLKNCPPHYIHLLMGLLFYLLSVYIEQKKYLAYLVKQVK